MTPFSTNPGVFVFDKSGSFCLVLPSHIAAANYRQIKTA